MKKSLFIIAITFIIFINFRPAAFANDSSPSANTDLIDRVTTKAAEYYNELRRTYSGKIKAVGTTTITVTTADGDRSITTNDVTNFYRIRAGHTSLIDFSGLKVGDDVVGIGTVDPQNYEMTARQIIAKIQRYNLVGVITDVSKNTLTIQKPDNQTAVIDLADAISLEKTDIRGKIQNAKEEDFQKGNQVFVIGYLANLNTTTFSTLKALVYFK